MLPLSSVSLSTCFGRARFRVFGVGAMLREGGDDRLSSLVSELILRAGLGMLSNAARSSCPTTAKTCEQRTQVGTRKLKSYAINKAPLTSGWIFGPRNTLAIRFELDDIPAV